MFGIGVPELILILVVGLIVFGPGKLPEMGRTLGKGIREFRKASNALTQAINTPDPPPVPRAEQSAPPDAQITPTAETAAAAVAVHQAAENKEHIETAAKEQSAAEQKTESKSSAAS